MFSKTLLLATLALEGAVAFPFVMEGSGINLSLMKRQQSNPSGPGSARDCPFNPNHRGAVPFNPKYPYNHAKDGQPGLGKGGYRVPAPGDRAHRFIAPDYSKDIRGPCPGLNTPANHGFLSRDGIVTFQELVDMQQNVWNVGYDLANLLAVLGLTTTDGDPVTMRLSIGCDATERTALLPGIQGRQPGLDGHNKFEADTSLTRNDYFTHNGDNYSMNSTLWTMMLKSTGGLMNLENLAKYREERYIQSRAENPNFYFGPLSLLLFGAASFLYELFPSGTNNYVPDTETLKYIFGAEKNKKGKWFFNGKEQMPPNWTNRVDPYDNNKVGEQIIKMYLLHPVPFGGNTGDGQFTFIDGPNGIKNGNLTATDPTSVMCLIYQLSTERFPTSLNGFLTPTIEAINLAADKLAPAYKNLGCPQPLT